MHVRDLSDLLDAWLRSVPSVRGYDVVDAELRFRPGGRGRVAVALRPRAGGATAAAEDGGGGAPVPLGTPVRAFAEFGGVDELEQILGVVKPAAFYFEDERPDTGDPLRDR